MNSTTNLTPQQRRDIERAQALLDAAEHTDPAVLAEEIEAQSGRMPRADDLYPEAFGLARSLIGHLLAIIDDRTGGQL